MKKLKKNFVLIAFSVLLSAVYVSCSGKSSGDGNKADVVTFEEKKTILPLTQNFEYISYMVQEGDSLTSIAARFGIKLDVLIVCNNINNAWNLKAGDMLKIPNMDGLIYKVKSEDTVEGISLAYQVPEEVIRNANNDSLMEGQLLFIPGAKISISQIIENVNEYEVNGFIINDVNGQIHILDYIKKYRKSVRIPETINNLPVTEIGINAFSNKGLTSVTIPTTVVNIGCDAFEGNKLTSIIIPDNVRTIGSMAFTGNKITHITIGSNVDLGRRIVFYDHGSVVDYGPFGFDFNGYYIVTGMRAGVYVYKNNFWSYYENE
jgi:LysM repeat protein